MHSVELLLTDSLRDSPSGQSHCWHACLQKSSNGPTISRGTKGSNVIAKFIPRFLDFRGTKGQDKFHGNMAVSSVRHLCYKTPFLDDCADKSCMVFTCSMGQRLDNDTTSIPV